VVDIDHPSELQTWPEQFNDMKILLAFQIALVLSRRSIKNGWQSGGMRVELHSNDRKNPTNNPSSNSARFVSSALHS